jgi:type IV secretory pathway VirB10-like protein
MFSNRAAVAILAFGCLTAAGVGGYLAVRQNQGSAAIAAPAPAAQAASSAGSTTSSSPSLPPVTSSSGSISSDATATPAGTPAITSAKATATPSMVAARAATPAAQQPTAAASRASSRNEPSVASSAPAPEPVADSTPAQADAPARADDVRAQEIAQSAEPPKVPEKSADKRFDELVVSADSVIGLRLETTVNSERARVEDRVEARVTRDVRVGGRIAIPTGSQVIGSVIAVERGGKFKEPARIEIRFNTLLLADGTRLPISTETFRRTGEAPGNSTAQKIGGGAIVGTILGGILGGAKGAAIGAAAGAGGGAAATAAGDRAALVIPAGTEVTVRFVAPVAVTIER